ncbi:hypothetical protein ACU81Q_10240 [Komagataeibacter melomenusus]
MSDKKDDKKSEDSKKNTRKSPVRPPIFTQFTVDRGMNIPTIAPGDIMPDIEDMIPVHLRGLLRKKGKGPF